MIYLGHPQRSAPEIKRPPVAINYIAE